MGEGFESIVEGIVTKLPGGDFSPIGAVQRGDVIAVAAESSVAFGTVIAERRNGDWTLPTMLGMTRGVRPSARRATTEPHEAIDELAVTQSGRPEGGTLPPRTAWLAVTGWAAQDAKDVVVRSDADEHVAAVRDDGFFIGLVRARWGSEPSVAVHTHDGRRVSVSL